MDRCLNKPRIELVEENLIWTPLIPTHRVTYEPEEIYNILQDAETFTEAEVVEDANTSLVIEKKKKRRRRWNKAYDHNNRRRRRTKPNTSSVSVKVEDEDELSQLMSHDEAEEDTEEEEDDNEMFDENSMMSNGSPHLNGVMDATPRTSADDNSCDMLGEDHSRLVASTSHEEDLSPSRRSLRRASSSIKPPVKKLDFSAVLVNGNSKSTPKTNGRISDDGFSDEDSSRDSHRSTRHHRSNGKYYTNNHDSHRSLTNGIMARGE